MLKKKMEEIYKTIPLENIPWNLEKPPKILRELIEEGKIKPCKAMELGCGIGNYVMYLAGKGFDVTGVDFSETAIEIARNTAGQRGIRCTFVAVDVLSDIHEISTSFDFVFDWELLHHIFPEERERYIKNVHRLMNPRGYYLSVCFSEDSSQFGGSGKYRKTSLGTTLYFSSENELKSLFEKYFQIEILATVEIEGKIVPHKAIYSLVRKGSNELKYQTARKDG